MDYIHIQDTLVGHPWNVAKVLEDVIVYRFSKNSSYLSSNSGREIKWLHAMTEEHFLAMSSKEVVEFKKLYGSYITALHISYGEVVGLGGWDVTFLPSDVIE